MSHPRRNHSPTKVIGVIALVAIVAASLAFAFASDSGSSALSPAAVASSNYLGDASSATYVYAGSPTTNYNGANPVDASHVSYRTLLQFGTDIPAGSVIASAALTFTPDTTGDGTYSVRAEGPYAPSTVTWANQPAFSPVVLGRSLEPVTGKAQTVALTGVTQTGTIGVAVDYSTPGVIAKLFGMAGPAPRLAVTYSSATPPTTTTTGVPPTTTTTGVPPTTTTTGVPPTTTTTGVSSGTLPGIMVLTEEGQPGYSSIQKAQWTAANIVPNFVTAPPISTSANGGKGTGFNGQTGNSMPNYLALGSGSTWGYTSDATSSGLGNVFNNTPSLFSQAVSHGVPLIAFAENVTSSNVTNGSSSNGYYSRHNAYSYFTHLSPSTVAPAMNNDITVPAASTAIARSSASTTTKGSIPFYESYLTNTPGTLTAPKTQASPYKAGTALLNNPADEGAFVYYAPNGLNEAHDTNGEDQFLSNFIPAVQSTLWYKHGGIIVVTWDNDGGTNLTTAQIGKGGSGFDQPKGGDANFYVIAKGLDSRVTSNPVNPGGTVSSNGHTVSVAHVLTQPISQIGLHQSIEDYYSWGYNPMGSSPNSGNASSAAATHPEGQAANPLPMGHGTILPLLELAKSNVGG